MDDLKYKYQYLKHFSSSNISVQSSLAECIRNASSIILDKVQLMHSYVFIWVHRASSDRKVKIHFEEKWQLGTSFWNLYHTWWNLLREFDKACYPELCKKSFNEKICNWAIMAATNERVDQINQNKGGLEIGQLLSLFKSTEFKTVHKHPYSQRNFWIPWLHLVCPLHILLLKRYFLIILIRNYNPKRRTSK